MLIRLILVGLLAGSTLSLPDYSEIKRFKDLPIPRLTKNMEPADWFPVFEKLHPASHSVFYQQSFLYYVDTDVVECNLDALKRPYDEMKRYLRKCDFK